MEKEINVWLPEVGSGGSGNWRKVVTGTHSQLYDKAVLGYNVQHDDHNSHCYTVYLKVAERVNPKSPHHKENTFVSFFSSYLYEGY